MPDLSTFQRDFAAALRCSDESLDPSAPPAFAVYRNTCARGAVEALRDTFATVNDLIGPDMFTGLAVEYCRHSPPANPVLSDYGSEFPAFLARQPWTTELPYLADVACLDRLWLESFLATGADNGAPSSSTNPRILLHPATRFTWLQTPALTIWQAHRQPHGFEELEPEWREEGALFTRRGLEVQVQPLDRESHYLLLLANCSSSIDECIAAVADAYPQSDVPSLIRRCVTTGALVIR